MNKRVLFIGMVWPEPTSSAAGTRILQLINLFQIEGYEVFFSSSSEKSIYSDPLTDVQKKQISLNSSEFDDWVKEISPDIVVFDRFISEEQYGWRIRENSPNTLTILDTEDLHFLRNARELQLKKGSDELAPYLYNDTTKRELASILRCDLSIIISKFELKLLLEKFQINQSIINYLPLFPPKADVKETFEERNHFLFIGNCLHKPNSDAIIQLKKNIWPQIRQKLPKAELHIYGAYISQQIKELNDEKTGFLIRGRADSIKVTFPKYRVLLAPLRFGAGQKGKLIEAMAFNLPSITSSIGAEGIASNENWSGFVTDNWSEFAEKAVEFYTNEGYWNGANVKASKILIEEFDEPKLKKEFLSTINYIVNDLENHRQKNFLSQILNSNTLNTYKYLSKWIELKNSIYTKK